MTETTPVNQANPYGMTSGEIFDGEYLSGESLMFYISTRLNDLDGSISDLMGMQRDALARKEYLNEVKAWLHEYENFNGQFDYGGDQPFIEAQDPLMQQFPMPPEGHPLRQFAEELRNEFHGLNGPSQTQDQRAASLEEFGIRLEQVVDEIDGQSELNMIRLQQEMGQRQIAIQLTTNILSKFNQGLEAITGNLR